MVAGNVNDLAKSIRDSVVPQWLHEYLAEHRDRLKAELKLFGNCEIPMPDGRIMEIKLDKPGSRGNM